MKTTFNKIKLLHTIKFSRSKSKPKTLNISALPKLFLNLQSEPNIKQHFKRILYLKQNKTTKNAKSKNGKGSFPKWNTLNQTINTLNTQANTFNDSKPIIKVQKQVIFIKAKQIIIKQETNIKLEKKLFINKVKVIQRYWKKYDGVIVKRRLLETARMIKEIHYFKKVILIQRHYRKYYSKLYSIKVILIQRKVKMMLKSKQQVLFIKRILIFKNTLKRIIFDKLIQSLRIIQAFKKMINNGQIDKQFRKNSLYNKQEKFELNIMKKNTTINKEIYGVIKTFPRHILEKTVMISTCKRQIDLSLFYIKENIEFAIISPKNNIIIQQRPKNKFWTFNSNRRFLGKHSSRNKQMMLIQFIQKEYKKRFIIINYKKEILYNR